MDTPVLEARGINAWYGASHVVRDVNFVVNRGETVALMGRNGMGKTTLLRSLLGLLRAPAGRVSGSVRVHGYDMSHAAPHAIARAGIAYVPEGRGIFPNLSVRENLVMAARGADGRAKGWTLGRVLDTFPRLAERLSHGGGQLSGGEQQMLTIGRALMTNPDLLILDEATEGLAPLVAREIWGIVRAFRGDGIASVIVDKNFAAVSAIADRAQILLKGQTGYEGRSADLRADPALHLKFLGV
ncbi:MAG: ABC transporter ATP-binding protein [Betaproteobacteria bacterium]|nr:ABC transporter ATP-binding protein [Betaproteobacteria bacterium]